MSRFYVAVALSELEAVAVKSACAAVVTSLIPSTHPLFTGMLKIEDAYRDAKAAEDSPSLPQGETPR